jgi:hypothetical protein
MDHATTDTIPHRRHSCGEILAGLRAGDPGYRALRTGIREYGSIQYYHITAGIGKYTGHYCGV